MLLQANDYARTLQTTSHRVTDRKDDWMAACSGGNSNVFDSSALN